MNRIVRLIVFAGLFSIFASSWPGVFAQPSIDTLGWLPGGNNSYAYGLSPEGGIVAGNALAQAPDPQWSIIHGGTADDYMHSVQQTMDGGFIFAGQTASAGAGVVDAWMIKSNSDGAIIWEHTYGGSSSDAARSVEQTTDEGYIFAGAQPGVDTLGVLPGGISSQAKGLSPEGEVVAGAADDGANQKPVRWTRGAGLEIFTLLPGGAEGEMVDASRDGMFFAGSSRNLQGNWVACRWSGPNSIMSLGFLPSGNYSFAKSISHDGLTVAGDAISASGQTGFRWTQAGGMVSIGDLPGGQYYALVERMSGDGNVVVGWSRTGPSNVPHAFRWTAGGGMVDMGTLPGYTASVARSASFDGSVIVGQSTFSDPTGQTIQAFRWTAGGGMQGLGFLPGGQHSNAYGVSDDGRVVVGRASTAANPVEAFIWRENIGMLRFTDFLLNEHGIDISAWNSIFITDISADGTVFSGRFTDANNRWRGWRIKLSPIAITTPTAGDRWLVGQRKTIRFAIGNLQGIQIDLSTDDGASYRLIDFLATTGDSSYVWQIPDTLRSSSRCRIRISDLLDSTSFAISERFTIKAYDLVRVQPDSTLDPFFPNKHGWSYQNSAANMWPISWWQQFNYQGGSDPITGLSYPAVFRQLGAQPQDFTDWPLFASGYGTDQCYFSTTLGLYESKALKKWRRSNMTWGGSCYGFAISSLLAFRKGDDFLNRFPGIPQADSINALFLSNTIRKAINEYWPHQFGKIALLNDAVMQNMTPRVLLSLVRDRFADETREPSALSFFRVGGSGAHTVLPYHLVEDANNPGKFKLFLYDSNSPNTGTSFIYIDSTANTWSDSTVLGYPTANKMCYLEPPIDAFLQNPQLNALNESSGGRSNESVTGFIEIYIPPGSNVRLRNHLGGEISHIDSVVTSTFSEGLAIIPKIGGDTPPLGFYVPDDMYTATVSAFPDSQAYFTVFSDSLIYNYQREAALPGESDDLRCEEGLGVTNSDNVAKTVLLETVALSDTNERTFSIINISMNPNDSLHVEAMVNDELRLLSSGAVRQYDLEVHAASANGAARFNHRQVPLPANSSHRIIPAWDNLLQQPVKILIDLGSDGTIDDSLLVSHQPVGLDDGARGRGGDGTIPERFALEQNYPNPFNPSTIIRYALPEGARVSLVVYDLLGREVKTLVNESVQPGNHTVQWNGRDEAGSTVASGVYLYRLQAGKFVQTRKMLLVR